MNKKQMIILWILGIWISWVIIDAGSKFFFFYGYRGIPLRTFCAFTIPPLIIGGLLIYTLRTRK